MELEGKAENWQKIKLLRLSEMLRLETDEEHPLTTAEICNEMENMGIPYDRRVLSRDVALLNSVGIQVSWKWVGKSKAFYIEDRSFSVPELKILIDSVQAAGFVTEKKTNELVGKIATLGGSHSEEILNSSLVHFNTRKCNNESVCYSIDTLETALLEKEKVIFRYFDLDINGERVYRRDGHHYVVEPVALVCNQGNYYAVVYSSRHGDIANYRIDRMDNVEAIDDDVSKKALELRDSIGEYTQAAFKMYGGPIEKVVLEFDKSLIGAVYDQFGDEITMSLGENDKIVATVRIQLSPTFWGWIFQFGKKMNILSPQNVIDERKARLKELVEGCDEQNEQSEQNEQNRQSEQSEQNRPSEQSEQSEPNNHSESET